MLDLSSTWTDACNAEFDSKLEKISASLKPHFVDMRNLGFTIFEKCFSESEIDDLLQSFSDFEGDLIYKRLGKYAKSKPFANLSPSDRIVDMYGVSAELREVLAGSKLCQFLNLYFEETPVATQSIYFGYGSNQSIHQDTAYVISQKPLMLAACWIALEDIQEGSGNLAYYPGSHKFDPFLFGGNSRSWTPSKHGQEEHSKFLASLHEQARIRNIDLSLFNAKKGDVLIWHADLAHGGSKVINNELTRKSIVFHFVPESIKPAYITHLGDSYYELSVKDLKFASRHYDLQKVDDEGVARIIYYPVAKNS